MTTDKKETQIIKVLCYECRCLVSIEILKNGFYPGDFCYCFGCQQINNKKQSKGE